MKNCKYVITLIISALMATACQAKQDGTALTNLPGHDINSSESDSRNHSTLQLKSEKDEDSDETGTEDGMTEDTESEDLEEPESSDEDDDNNDEFDESESSDDNTDEETEPASD